MSAMNGAEHHAYCVARWPQHYPQPCVIVRSDWPYDCDAKRLHPDHDVFRCQPHGVWWHQPAGKLSDMPYRYHAGIISENGEYEAFGQGFGRRTEAEAWLRLTLEARPFMLGGYVIAGDPFGCCAYGSRFGLCDQHQPVFEIGDV